MTAVIVIGVIAVVLFAVMILPGILRARRYQAAKQASEACRLRGDHAQAEAHLREAMALEEIYVPPDHPQRAVTLNSLAVLCKMQGRLEEAGVHFKQALAIMERATDERDEACLQIAQNLGTWCMEMGEYSDGERYLQRVLEVRQEGPEDLHLAMVLNNLGTLKKKLARWDEAQSLYERSVAVREATAGPDHVVTSLAVNNLGLLHLERGHLDEAQALLERAQAIGRKADKPDLNVDHNLARVIAARGDVDEARRRFDDVLERRRETQGDEHPDTAETLHCLGQLELVCEDAARAEALLRQATELREQALGRSHIDTIDSLHELARALEALGRSAEAKPLLKRVIDVREEVLGTDHPEVAAARETEAGVLRSLGD